MSKNSQSGLDINLGNACSKDAYAWAKKTFANRDEKAGANASKVDGGFSNLLLFGNQRIGIGSDGIGTKIELAERTGIYNTIGFDLMAMVVDDLATAGLEPTNLSNILDVDVLDQEIVNQLMSGLHDAANFAGVSITGGEIAELGNRIGGYGDKMHFNWCSTAIGVLPNNLEQGIDGSAIEAGDLVISLQSHGFRSNGFSALRRIMQKSFGDKWHSEPYSETKTWGQILLTPSLIYSPLINQLIKDDLFPTGIVHITGGGIEDNFQRLLKVNQLGAELTNLFEPLPVMERVVSLGKVPRDKAYLYWNMGNGMLLTCKEKDAAAILETAASKKYAAKIAGTISKNSKIQLEA